MTITQMVQNQQQQRIGELTRKQQGKAHVNPYGTPGMSLNDAGDYRKMIPVDEGVVQQRCSTGRIILSSLFVCYITGLLCLTLFNSIIGDIYYFLFYHAPSGRSHQWFTFEYDFIPDFFHNFGAENLGNIVMFLPFGILYPLFREGSTWKRTLVAGFMTTFGIELLQPVFGRSFDINDIILNSLGVIASTIVFYTLKMFFYHGREAHT